MSRVYVVFIEHLSLVLPHQFDHRLDPGSLILILLICFRGGDISTFAYSSFSDLPSFFCAVRTTAFSLRSFLCCSCYNISGALPSQYTRATKFRSAVPCTISALLRSNTSSASHFMHRQALST